MTVPHILAGVIIAAAACLLLLAFPVIRCPRCLGKRVLRRRTRRGRRARKCPVCRGAAHIVPPGATFVHRSFWAIGGERIRERRRDENTGRLAARREEP